MARRVFFSFHYQNDIWRVNVVRNSYVIEGCAAAGFQDASLWEEAKKKGDAAIKRMIDDNLIGTSVTCVLIGSQTAYREFVNYEIEKSIERGNGLFGVRVHMIKDKDGKTDVAGLIPWQLQSSGAPVYDWEYGKFGDWVEAAAKKAEQEKIAKAFWGKS